MSDHQEHLTIGDVVRRPAAASPDAPALVAEGRPPLSYAALVDVMDRFQRVLNGMGLGRQDRIAIGHPSNTAMASIVMGVWGCATAAPMNPEFTVGEFAVFVYFLGFVTDAGFFLGLFISRCQQASVSTSTPKIRETKKAELLPACAVIVNLSRSLPRLVQLTIPS